MKPPNCGYFADTHPVMKRLDAFYGRMHKAMQELFPEEMKFVPRPRPLVVQSSDLNSLHVQQQLCVPLKVVLQGHKAKSRVDVGLTAEAGRLEFDDLVRIDNDDWCGDSGFQAVTSAEDRARFVADLEASMPSCHARIDKSLLSVSEACLGKDQVSLLAGDQYAKGVLVTLGSNRLVISSEFVRRLSEPEVQAILAHEAAHYYRGHGLSGVQFLPGMALDQIYTVTDELHPKKPEPSKDPALLALVKRNAEAVRGTFTHLPLKVHFRTIRVISQLTRVLASKNLDRVSKECSAFDEALAAALSSAKGTLDPRSQSPETLRSLGILDDATGKCVALLSDRKSSEIVGLLGAAPGEEGTKLKNALGELGMAADDARTLAQIVETHSTLESQTDEAAKKYASLIKEAHLGVYSKEVEADELSVALLMAAGASPEAASLVQRSVWRFTSEVVSSGLGVRPFEPSWAECAKAQNSGWRSADLRGILFFGVPDSLDDHPQACFRSWNVANEAKLYGPGGMSAPNPPSNATEWNQVVKTLDTIPPIVPAE